MKRSELKQLIKEELDNYNKKKNNLNEAPKFAKKQYTEIANILKNAKSVDEVRNEIANMFEKDNPRFNREKFLEAAGGK